MKTKLQTLTLAIGTLVFAALAEAGPLLDLGVNGGTLRHLSKNADGTVIFATMDSQSNAAFYSTDFGDNWSPVAGGMIYGGPSDGIAANEHGTYLNWNRFPGFMRSPAIINGAYKPLWEPRIQTYNKNLSGFGIETQVGILSVGKFILFPFAKTTKTRELGVYDTQRHKYLESSSWYDGTKRTIPSSIAYFKGYVYVVTGWYNSTVDSSGKYVFRAPFDENSGALGAFSDVTSQFSALYDAGPYEMRVIGISTPRQDQMYVRVLSKMQSDTADNYRYQRYYRSLDGISFTVVAPADEDGYSIDRDQTAFDTTTPDSPSHSCAFGDALYINGLRSLDGGETWDRVRTSVANTVGTLERGACVFGATKDEVLVRSAGGIARSRNFTAPTPDWDSANHGITAVSVATATQSPANENLAAISTPYGIGLSTTFASERAMWTFPLCTVDKENCRETGLAFHPTSSTSIYAGKYSIEKGTIDSEGAVTWAALTDLRDLYAGRFPTLIKRTRIRTYSFAPTSLFVSVDGVDRRAPTMHTIGGILELDADTGSVVRSMLDGTPISDFLLINPNVIYAASEVVPINGTGAAGIGLYRSIDGGSTWTQLSSKLVGLLAYDSTRDTIYAHRGNSDGIPGYDLITVTNASSSSPLVSARTTMVTFPRAMVVDPASGTVILTDQNYTASYLDMTSTGLVYNYPLLPVNDVAITTFLLLVGKGQIVPTIANQESHQAGTETMSVGAGTSEGFSVLSLNRGICGVTFGGACAGGFVKKGNKCTLTVSYSNLKKRVPGLKFTIEQKVKGKGWKKFQPSKGAPIFGKKGTYSTSVIADREHVSYRAKVKFGSDQCVTSERVLRTK